MKALRLVGRWFPGLMASCFLLAAPATADVVTDWNIRSTDIAVAAGMPTPPTVRVMAIVQTSVYEAVNAITRKGPPGRLKLEVGPGASIDAAVAAACRTSLTKLVPQQVESIERAYMQAIASIPDNPAKSAGVAVGQKAAEGILALSADPVLTTHAAYQPSARPGVYVPTTIPAALHWPKRKPWVLSTPDQFRPAPPPALNSELWAKDYNEIKALGSRASTRRTAEQTEIAKFWEASAPTIYLGVCHSVAQGEGRDVTQNARFLQTVTQAMDDAAIAVFDAKYHYNFWRPITAIRNGDADDNGATEQDLAWTPFIDTPMHPEYPCAHCIMAATVGTVVQAEVGKGTMPRLSTRSPSAPGVERSWTSVDALIQEVSEARIYDGVHYRNSTEVGAAMGRQVGALVAEHYLKARP